jgi:hypothetical protein
MVTSHRYLAAGLFALGVLVSAPACATGYAYGRNPDIRDYRELDRRAYDNGFRDGFRNGERDARDRRDFRVDRDGDYRSADDGYRREGGYDRDQYRRSFRRGYESGYRDGFERMARSYGGYRDRSVTPGIVIRPPVVIGPRGGYGGYNSPAAENGYRDGLDAGRNDARDRDRFDPRRAKRYREGDHDYDRRYGDRNDYKREYRSAFEQGYREGYERGR